MSNWATKMAFFGLGGLQKSLTMTDCSTDGGDGVKGGNKSDALWAGGVFNQRDVYWPSKTPFR